MATGTTGIIQDMCYLTYEGFVRLIGMLSVDSLDVVSISTRLISVRFILCG